MEPLEKEYNLSAVLAGHEEQVRAVCFVNKDTVATSSRDGKVRVWTRQDQTPPVYESREILKLEEKKNFVHSIAFLPGTSNHEALILSGDEKGCIDVRSPDSSHKDGGYKLLKGHSANVCALGVCPSGDRFASGGWDSRAIIWSAKIWDKELLLEGHTGSVLAVLVLDEVTVITGSADTYVRKFVLGKVKPPTTVVFPDWSIKTPSDVRALCKLPPGHSSGAHFASAHVDDYIMLWKSSGDKVERFKGHENSIWSLTVSPTGLLVSSGEDRTVRIWDGTECVQCITIPAISVWSVACCQETGDIVAGSSDGIASIFTQDSTRKAGDATISQFKALIQASTVSSKTTDILIKRDPAWLETNSGSKEGEQAFVNEHDGTIGFYTWSMSSQEWVKVGTVEESASSTGNKVEYQGKMYDFVFDVAIEEGQPSLKLPYNVSENPYERAQKFINDNELSINYLDQIAHFITENTKGTTIGETQQTGGPDPLGTESRYMPGQTASLPKQLPVISYTQMRDAKYEPLFNAIDETNAKLKGAGRKDISLSPSEMGQLRSLGEALETKTQPDNEAAFRLLLRSLASWPYTDRRALMDLLRSLALYDNIAGYLDPEEGSVVDIALRRALVDGGEHPDLGVMMGALRVAATVCNSAEGRLVAASSAEEVVTALERALMLHAAYKPVSAGQENLKDMFLYVTAATALNFVVLRKLEGEESGINDELAQRVGVVLKKIVAEQAYIIALEPALAALGTLVIVDMSVAPGVREAVHAAVVKVTGNEKFRALANEVLGLLP